jgi:hypothetical protein
MMRWIKAYLNLGRIIVNEVAVNEIVQSRHSSGHGGPQTSLSTAYTLSSEKEQL